MGQSASETAVLVQERNNNFGVLRLVFAGLVLFSHSYDLVGQGEEDPTRPWTNGLGGSTIAVNSFFLISGYLVRQSWERSRSAGDFLRKRILRIYPGYVVALVFSILVGLLSAWPQTVSYLRYLAGATDRLARAVLFLEYGVLDHATTFATNPYVYRVNGSLWTLQPELRCYAVLLVLGMFGWLRRWWPLLVLWLVAYNLYIFQALFLGAADSTLWHFFTYFFLGALCARCPQSFWRWRLWRVALVVGLWTVLGGWPKVANLVCPLLGGYLVFVLAWAPVTWGAPFFANHDLSYGVYLYAFPVQQLLIQWCGLREPLLVFALALPITLGLAWLSWHWVEAPCLAKKAQPPGL